MSDTKKLKVAKLIIRNVLGIEEFEVAPGAVTVVEGGNAQGKTSILESLKAALDGGHDASLLRKGAEKGEVVLVLEDGLEIVRTITHEKSDVAVRHPSLGPISKKRTYIKDLVDALSVNPVEFLNAPKKQRLQVLLEALPLKVTVDRIAEATGIEGFEIDEDQHGLEVLEEVRKATYDDRTGINREAKGKRATAEQMKATLPEGAEPIETLRAELEGVSARLRDLNVSTQRAVKEAKESAERRERELRDAFVEEKEKAHITHSESTREINEEAERRIAEIRKRQQEALEGVSKKRDKRIQAAAERRDEAVAEVQAERERKLEELRLEYEPRRDELTERVATLKARLEAEQKASEARRFIAELENEAEGLEKESERLTAALEGLDRLKSELVSQLPIKGLEVRDGEIHLDGISFERLSGSEQVRLAIEVAKLRAGTLPIVAVDGLECLDEENFEEFCRQAADSGLQFVVSRVTSGERRLRLVEGGVPA